MLHCRSECKLFHNLGPITLIQDAFWDVLQYVILKLLTFLRVLWLWLSYTLSKKHNRWNTELYHDERGDPPGISNQNGCTIMKSENEKSNWQQKWSKLWMTKASRTSETYATLFTTQLFVRLSKKAKATECSDYRTLSLMSHILKILQVLNVIDRNSHTKQIYNWICDQRNPKWLYGRKMYQGRNLESENNYWDT